MLADGAVFPEGFECKQNGTCEQQELLRQTQTAANASVEVTNKEATVMEYISLTGLIKRFWAFITLPLTVCAYTSRPASAFFRGTERYL